MATQRPSKVNEAPRLALVILDPDQGSHSEPSWATESAGSEVIHPHFFRNFGVRSAFIPIVVVFPGAQFLEKREVLQSAFHGITVRLSFW